LRTSGSSGTLFRFALFCKRANKLTEAD